MTATTITRDPARERLAPPHVARPVTVQHVLRVEFESVDGRRWDAIGGGPTVTAAIAYARESCPDDAKWRVVGWNDLYGE